MRRYGHEKRLQTCSSFTSRNINLALQWRAAGPPPVGRKARRAVSTARRARRYEALEDSLRGEMHEVCPKFLAFKGPLRPGHPARLDGEVAFPAEHYARLFRDMGVRAVVHPPPPHIHPATGFDLKICQPRQHPSRYQQKLLPPAPISSRGRERGLEADSLRALSPRCAHPIPPPARRKSPRR